MGILSFIKEVCVQKAVYWGSPGSDGYKRTYADAEQLEPPEDGVRWDETAEVMTDDQGKEFVTKAQVMCPKELDVGGLLYLGDKEDLTEEEKSDPRKVEGVREIRRVDKTPLFKSKDEFVYQIYVG